MIPKYIKVYWGRTPTIKELRNRFQELENAYFGYKKNEYKDLERFFKRKDIRKIIDEINYENQEDAEEIQLRKEADAKEQAYEMFKDNERFGK